MGVIAHLLTYPGAFRPWLWAPFFHYTFGDIDGRLQNIAYLKSTGNIYGYRGFEDFTYPPGAILLFFPWSWLGLARVHLLWTLLTEGCLALSLAIVAARVMRWRPSRAAAAACLGTLLAVVALPPVMEAMSWGQTSSILLLLVVADVWLLPPRWRGTLIGVAAGLKIYPGAFILVALWRRRWGEAARATAAAALLTAASGLVWPRSLRGFLPSLLAAHSGAGRFVGGLHPHTSSSNLADFFMRPPFSTTTLTLAEVVVISLVALGTITWIGARLWDAGLVACAVVVTLFASTVGSLVAWDHYFCFVALLPFAWVELRRARLLAWPMLAALVGFLVPVFWVRDWLGASWELDLARFVAENLYLLGSLAVVATGALATRDSRPQDPTPPSRAPRVRRAKRLEPA
jgi:alpha-1,2-mannosyltransferase